MHSRSALETRKPTAVDGGTVPETEAAAPPVKVFRSAEAPPTAAAKTPGVCSINDGNKKAAAEGLSLLREPAEKYFVCIVCGRTVFTKRTVKYQFDTKITQGDAAGRELVRVGRKHCDEFHRNTWVWNLVPDSGWLTCEERRDGHDRAHLDGLLQQAMSVAARKMPVATDTLLDYMQVSIVFCQRVLPKNNLRPVLVGLVLEVLSSSIEVCCGI
jgi:hypothetical protein